MTVVAVENPGRNKNSSASAALSFCGDVGAGEPALHDLAAHLFNVDSPTVVGYADRQLAGAMGRLDAQPADLGFSGRLALGGRLEAVVQCIAHQVIQRGIELFENVAVDLGRFPLNLQLHVLAELPGQIANQSRQPLHALAKRPHAAGDDLAIQPRTQIIGITRAPVKLPNAIGEQVAARRQPPPRVGQQGGGAFPQIVGAHRLAESFDGLGELSLQCFNRNSDLANGCSQRDSTSDSPARPINRVRFRAVTRTTPSCAAPASGAGAGPAAAPAGADSDGRVSAAGVPGETSA